MNKERTTVVNYTPQNCTVIKDSSSGKWIPLRNFTDAHEPDDVGSAEDENAQKEQGGKQNDKEGTQ